MYTSCLLLGGDLQPISSVLVLQSSLVVNPVQESILMCVYKHKF